MYIHIYIYTYIYNIYVHIHTCVCVCVCVYLLGSHKALHNPPDSAPDSAEFEFQVVRRSHEEYLLTSGGLGILKKLPSMRHVKQRPNLVHIIS